MLNAMSKIKVSCLLIPLIVCGFSRLASSESNCSDELQVYRPKRLLAGIKQKSLILHTKKLNETPHKLILSFKKDTDQHCTVHKLLNSSIYAEGRGIFLELEHGFPQLPESFNLLEYTIVDRDNKTLAKVSQNYAQMNNIDNFIILETDKPIYKIGETLIVRVIIIDSFKLLKLENFINAECTHLKESEEHQNNLTKIVMKNSNGKTVGKWELSDLNKPFHIVHRIVTHGSRGLWSLNVLKKSAKFVKLFRVDDPIPNKIIPTIKIKNIPKWHLDSKNYKESDNVLRLFVCGKFLNGVVIKGTAKGTVCKCITNLFYLVNNIPMCVTGRYELTKCIHFTMILDKNCESIDIGLYHWRVFGYLTGDIEVSILFQDEESELHTEKSIIIPTFKNEPVKKIEKEYEVQYNLMSHVEFEFPYRKDKVYVAIFQDSSNLFMTHFENISPATSELLIPPFKTSQVMNIYEENSNSSLFTAFINVPKRASKTAMTVIPNIVIYFNENVYLKSYKIKLMSNFNMDGKELNLFSQKNGKIVQQTYKLSRNPCIDRNDIYGHYTCEYDGNITCLRGYYGSNCLKHKCHCEPGCHCIKTTKCECFEDTEQIQRTLEPDIRSLFFYSIDIVTDENFEPEFKGILYHLLENKELVSSPIIFKNVQTNSYKSIFDHIVSERFSLSKIIATPGENITLIIELRFAYENLKLIAEDTSSDYCFIHAYDTLWKNWTFPNKDFFFDYKSLTEQYDKIFNENVPAIAIPVYDTLQLANLMYVGKCPRYDYIYKRKLAKNVDDQNLIRSETYGFYPKDGFFKTEKINSLHKGSSTWRLKSNLVAPSTFTEWNIKAFCVVNNGNLWIPEKELKLKVVKYFHIDVELPVQIEYTESFTAIVNLVFINEEYQKFGKLVTLYFFTNDDEWEIINGDRKQICVPPGNQSSIELFECKPKVTGKLVLNLHATADINNQLCSDAELSEQKFPSLSDSVRTTTSVVPKTTKEKIKTELVCLKNGEHALMETSIRIPNAKNLLKMYVSITSNMLSLINRNTDQTITQPYGFSDQIIASVSASLSLASYVSTNKNYTTSSERAVYDSAMANALRVVNYGYQQIQSYRLKDGSFQTFGKPFSYGSSTLTALVIKIFSKAKKIFKNKWPVYDEKFYESGIYSIKSAMDENECFYEFGDLYHPVKLNIRSIIQIIESLCQIYQSDIFENDNRMMQILLSMITNSTKCLEKKLPETSILASDINTLDILLFAQFTYAYKFLQDLELDTRFNFTILRSELVSLAKYDFNSNMRWWGGQYASEEYNIQATSIALLTLTESLTDIERIQTVKWLLSKQNEKGSFYFPKTTMLATEALSKSELFEFSSGSLVSAKITEQSSRSSIQFSLKSIDLKDYITYQFKYNSSDVAPELFSFTTEVTSRNEQTGCLQVGFHIVYNEVHGSSNYNDISTTFKIETKTIQRKHTLKTCRHPAVKICIRRQGTNLNSTGVLLLRLALPSGFILLKHNFYQNAFVLNTASEKVVLNMNNTEVNIYFSPFPKTESSSKCVSLELEQKIPVNKLKPGKIILREIESSRYLGTKHFTVDNCGKYWENKFKEIKEDFKSQHCICHINDGFMKLLLLNRKRSICTSDAKYHLLRNITEKIVQFPNLNLNDKCNCRMKLPILIYQKNIFSRIEIYPNSFNLTKVAELLDKSCF